MKIFFITALLILFGSRTAAQKNTINFSSVNQFGLLVGSKDESGMLQTINGIKKDNWFAGAGVGLDFYNERSIPLFLDIRRELTNKINTPFAYADAGINFAWLNFAQREQKQFPETSPGLFYDLGLGWKLSGRHNRGFLLSAGYTFKQVKEKIKYTVWGPAPGPGIESYESHNYLYRRLVIKLGFQL